MKICKATNLFIFFFYFVFFDGVSYGNDLFQSEEEEKNVKTYSFSFINNFPGNKDYSSDLVVIIVGKSKKRTKGDRKVLKVRSRETLKIDLPFNKIRVNVFMSSPLIETSPRKEYTTQEFLEKYGRLPSPRSSPTKEYEPSKNCFVTYEDIELPSSITFDQEE